MVISRDRSARDAADDWDRHRLLGRLRLKHLRLVDALARTGSLRQAAQVLSVTQPAASKILQDLEDVLGVQLFDRAARAITINEVGRFVAVYAQRVLGESERFGSDLARLTRSGHGTLTLGAIMVTAAELLPRAVMALKQARPGITVRIVESSSERLLGDLARNQFDFVLARLVREEDALAFDLQPLAEEPLCAYTAAGNTSLRRARTLADLHGHQWVIQDSPTPTRVLLEQAFARQGLTMPPHVVLTGSVYTSLNLVDKADMVGVLPVPMVRNEGRRFRILPVDLGAQLSRYGIVTRRGMALTPQAQEMIAILRGLADSPDAAPSRRTATRPAPAPARRASKRPASAG